MIKVFKMNTKICKPILNLFIFKEINNTKLILQVKMMMMTNRILNRIVYRNKKGKIYHLALYIVIHLNQINSAQIN